MTTEQPVKTGRWMQNRMKPLMKVLDPQRQPLKGPILAEVQVFGDRDAVVEAAVSAHDQLVPDAEPRGHDDPAAAPRARVIVTLRATSPEAM